MEVTAYQIAETWLGVRELPGKRHNPQIVAWIQEAGGTWIEDDETAWCSSFLFSVAMRLRLPVPIEKRLRARSWLQVGQAIDSAAAKIGFDIVVLKRGGGKQPGPEVIAAPGHVGLFSGYVDDRVYLLGGNQSNSVSVAGFPAERILGVRRLRSDG